MLKNLYYFLIPFAARMVTMFLLKVMVPLFEKLSQKTTNTIDDDMVKWFKDSVTMIDNALAGRPLEIREPPRDHQSKD